MALSEIVSVSISLSGANPTFANFGAGMFVAYHTNYSDRVRTYSSLAAVGTDFSTTTTVYAAASEFFAANPSPSTFMVGRRALAGTATYTLTALDATLGDPVSFLLEGKTVSTTAGASTSATAAAINTAITSATISTVTAAQVGSVITVTATTAGHVIRWQNWDITKVDLENTTADPGIATDMAAINNANPNFYGVTLDSQSDAEIKALGAWVASANLKEMFFDSGDTSITSTTTTDLFSVLKADTYTRSVPLYNGNDTWSYAGVALMAVSLVNTPGSYTLDLKPLVGVTPDNLTDTVASNIQGKNGNIYRTMANLNLTTKGTNSNGGYEDTQRFIDWLTNTMQIRLIALLAGVKKLPYTQKGIQTVGAVINGVLQDGIRMGGLSDDPTFAPVVNLPSIGNIAASFITARNLPNVTFQARLAGAIQTIPITGTLIGA